MEFLALITGAYVFWAVVFLAVIVLIANEKYAISGASLGVVGLVFILAPNGYGFGYLLSMEFLKIVGVYIGFGCAWAALRWLFTMWRIRGIAAEIVRKHGAQYPLNDTQKAALADEMSRHKYGIRYKFPPEPDRMKDDLYMWAAYWPFDLPWFILSVPTVHVWHWIYDGAVWILIEIRDKMFAKFT